MRERTLRFGGMGPAGSVAWAVLAVVATFAAVVATVPAVRTWTGVATLADQLFWPAAVLACIAWRVHPRPGVAWLGAATTVIGVQGRGAAFERQWQDRQEGARAGCRALPTGTMIMGRDNRGRRHHQEADRSGDRDRGYGSLEGDYPEVTFLHLTTPLTTEPGPEQKIRNALGRGTPDIQDDVAREQFNTLMRDAYDGPTLFDLAAMESTAPDGSRVQGTEDGQPYFALYDGYAADPGYLNAAGSQYAAAQLLSVIAPAAG